MNAILAQTDFIAMARLLSFGILCFAAIQALIVAVTGHRRQLYLVFSLLCLIAAGYALLEYLYYTAAAPSTAAAILRWRPIFGLTFTPVLFWFIALHADPNEQQRYTKWLVAMFVFSAGIICAQLIFQPVSPAFSLINIVGRPYAIIVLAWGMYRAVHMFRRGERRAAIFLASSLVIFFISVCVLTLVEIVFGYRTDWSGFSFLGLVLLMSISLGLDLRDRNRHIHYLAYHDELTGLANRSQLEEQLFALLTRQDGNSEKGALLIIGLDNFKAINDTLGHRVGDQLLQNVAARLRGCGRKDAVPARIGADDFALLLPNLGTDMAMVTNDAVQAAQEVTRILLPPHVLAGNIFDISACIGIVLFPATEGTETEVDILQRADLALHHAKLSGPGSIQWYDARMQTEIGERLRMETALQRAWENKEFSVYFQPQVAPSGEVVGAEALLRWHHPDEGFISPTIFIPAAEKCGLIRPIGEWVLEQTCDYIAACDRLDSPFKGPFSVNVSPLHFMQKDYEQSVRRQIVASGIDPSRLTLEITESAFISDLEDAISKIESLRELGIRFSIDDFGTGYASLSYLRRLPVHELKIDQSFVKNLGPDLRDMRLVQTIIEISKCMGLEIVAEGVATESQRRTLTAMNCRIFQGYLFSPPLDGRDFDEWVRRQNKSIRVDREYQATRSAG